MISRHIPDISQIDLAYAPRAATVQIRDDKVLIQPEAWWSLYVRFGLSAGRVFMSPSLAM